MATPDVRIRLSAEGVAEVVSAFQKVQAQAQAVGRQSAAGFAPMNAVLGGMKSMLASLAAALSVGALINFAKHASGVAEELGKMQQKLGSSAEGTAELAIAARLADMDIGKLQQGFSKFAQASVALVDGSGKVSDAFRRLGISASDLRGKDLAEQMMLVGQKFANLEDGPRKASLAIELFGRRGMQMIPFLNQLGDIGDTRLKRLAGYFGSETIGNVTMLRDEFKLLGLEAEGIGASFVSGMAEPISQGLRMLEADLVGSGNGWQEYGRVVGEALKRATFYVVDFIDGAIQKFGELFIRLRTMWTAYIAWQQLKFSEAARIMAEGQREAADWWATGEARHAARLKALNAPAEVKPTKRTQTPEEAAAEADKTAAARSNALRRQADAELKLSEAREKNQAALDKAAYDRGLMDLADYYGRRRGLLMESLEAEKSILAARRAEEAKKAPSAERTSTLAAIDAELATKEAEASGKTIALAEEERSARQRIADQIVAGYTKIMEAQGELHDVAMANIDAEVESFARAMNALYGAGSPEAMEAIRRYRSVLDAQEEAAEAARDAANEMAALDLERARIQARAAAGIQSQVSADKDLLDLDRARVPVLAAQAAEMLRTATAQKSPEAIEAARQFSQQVDAIAASVEAADNVMARMSATFQDAGTEALTDFFSTGIREAESFGEAMRNMVASVINALQRLLSEMLAVQIMQRAMGLFGVGLPTKSLSEAASASFPLPAPRARGGIILGAGTGTSDSIPALLSRGEYVVRASAVSRPGVLRQLEALNLGLSMPRLADLPMPRRYAAGGLVAAADGATTLDTSLTVGLEPGLVLRELESPDAQRVIVRALARNRRAVGQALGG